MDAVSTPIFKVIIRLGGGGVIVGLPFGSKKTGKISIFFEDLSKIQSFFFKPK